MQNTEQPNDTVQVPAAEIMVAIIHEVEALRKQVKGLVDVQRNQALALQRCGERLAMLEGRLSGPKRGIA